jgi:23S rRNA (adenine1618-N6)-methyltransferase
MVYARPFEIMILILATVRWIPDGQLCPTVPNRSNYIHWIEDLLSSDLIPPIPSSSGRVRGFDIGTGANCIYPLLGASLLGWSFVGSGMLLCTTSSVLLLTIG